MASEVVETAKQPGQVVEGERGALLAVLIMVVLGVAGIFAVSA